MAKKNNKALMMGLLVVGGGALLWYLSKNKQPAVVTPIKDRNQFSDIPAPLGNKDYSNTSAAIIPPQQQIAPTTNITTAVEAPTPIVTTQTPAAYDVNMETLNTWAMNSFNDCDLARWNQYSGAFTQDEWDGLFDIYFNDWIGGQGNTDARTQFWDNWRQKYNILTNTAC